MPARLACLALLALSLWGCRAPVPGSPPDAGSAAGLPVLPFGGDFTLTGDDGAPFHSDALRGRVVLVFFGYSSCPEACPTTLSKLAVVSRRLGDDASRVKTLYVSVDPERDSPAVLKADLANFRLDAVGLTGTKREIDQVVAQYGAEYAIVPTPESAARYTVTHSTWVYALDPQGKTRLRFPYEASVDEVVTGIRRLLE